MLSTVTYLTNDGAPTVLFPNLSLDASGQHYVREAVDGPAKPRRKMRCLFRHVGRHLAFDGRWLHGAPVACLPSSIAARTMSESHFASTSGSITVPAMRAFRRAPHLPQSRRAPSPRHAYDSRGARPCGPARVSRSRGSTRGWLVRPYERGGRERLSRRADGHAAQAHTAVPSKLAQLLRRGAVARLESERLTIGAQV